MSLAPRLAARLLPRLVLKLAEIFQARGNAALAMACLRQAARLDPADPLPHFLAGRQMLFQGEMKNAAEAFRTALQSRPDYAEAHNNLGVALYETGQIEEAARCYQSALRAKPDYAAAHNNLGNVQLSRGRATDAEASFRQALRLDPRYAEAHNNLALALKKLGRLQEAEQALHEALRIRPGFAGALSNLGGALQDQGKAEDAINAYHEALRLQPDLGEAHANLAILLGDTARMAQAVAYYEKELGRNPTSPEAHNRLGAALQAQNRWDDASRHFEEALSARPDYAEAYANIGNNHVFTGNVAKALENYGKALSLGPNSAIHSSYAFYLNYSPHHEPAQVALEYRRRAGRYALPTATPAFANPRQADRKLKVGYVSPDFRQHSVAYFIEPVIRNHDRSQFEVFCYSNAVQPDAVTERIKGDADHWHDIRLKTNEQVWDRIREDRIDILVDLAGHTSRNRLLVFARKPAPIQVTYLGHPNTSGLETMDYRISDSLADPPGITDDFHTEQLVRLPRCFLAYAPPADAPPVASPPFERKGHITFGSFNNAAKINPRVIAAWARILEATPGSRLVLKSFSMSSSLSKSFFLDLFASEGIMPGRVDLVDFLPDLCHHLDLYREIDIALDTFPYNGTTTTCEALWMGVPVVGLEGLAHVSRVGASLLSEVGLASLVASDVENYATLASELASDPSRLRQIRSSLRAGMRASALTDAVGLTRELEKAYREMWHQWCRKVMVSTDSAASAEIADDVSE